VRLSGVAACHKQNISEMNITNGIGHCSRTECCRQTGNRTGGSETRAVIDVVRADQSARHLLHEIVFFVRAFRRNEKTN